MFTALMRGKNNFDNNLSQKWPIFKIICKAMCLHYRYFLHQMCQFQKKKNMDYNFKIMHACVHMYVSSKYLTSVWECAWFQSYTSPEADEGGWTRSCGHVLALYGHSLLCLVAANLEHLQLGLANWVGKLERERRGKVRGELQAFIITYSYRIWLIRGRRGY